MKLVLYTQIKHVIKCLQFFRLSCTHMISQKVVIGHCEGFVRQKTTDINLVGLFFRRYAVFYICFLPSFYNCITHRTPMTVGLSMIVYVLYSHSVLY